MAKFFDIGRFFRPSQPEPETPAQPRGPNPEAKDHGKPVTPEVAKGMTDERLLNKLNAVEWRIIQMNDDYAQGEKSDWMDRQYVRLVRAREVFRGEYDRRNEPTEYSELMWTEAEDAGNEYETATPEDIRAMSDEQIERSLGLIEGNLAWMEELGIGEGDGYLWTERDHERFSRLHELFSAEAERREVRSGPAPADPLDIARRRARAASREPGKEKGGLEID